MKVSVLSADYLYSNNRFYPKEVVKNIIDQSRQMINDEQLFVTDQIPENGMVSMDDAAGIVKELTLEGNKLMVEFEFLENYKGYILRESLNYDNLVFHISGRSSVDITDGGVEMVNPDYELVCFPALPSYQPT